MKRLNERNEYSLKPAWQAVLLLGCLFLTVTGLYQGSTLLSLAGGVLAGIHFGPKMKIWIRTPDDIRHRLNHSMDNGPFAPWMRIAEEKGVFTAITVFVFVCTLLIAGYEIFSKTL